MQIYGPYRVSTSNVNSTNSTQPATRGNETNGTDKKRSSTPVDELQLSNPADRLSGAQSTEASESVASSGEIRIDRVAEIRRQIASGSYETPEKLDVALDRLLDSFA